MADRRTLALQVLLEALEADVAGSAQNEDAQEGLDVGAKTRFLTKEQQRGFYESPQYGNGDKEEPEEDNTALEVDRDGEPVAARKGLRTERVEGSGAAERDAPS